ncbi:E3 ubiquitin-protein ligase DMA2 [Penicillium diatomitis]|uniref:E3 ubiquitin-protein ligase DMA2 n=1 Tax=Penicillium diatomitis TaxID=2819901 RepID=A0A9W9XCZ4_9EURO|nr:E3 ubiquitin-protein ligase DMA2 [Penicillium diatomitis]KAJ5489125.1 E3 ubiquitin-protein ligase DMA2 [Penicillium diatomitis]
MSTSTTTAPTSLSEAPRPGRLRRFSQLRAYTQTLSSSTSSGHRSRNSLSSRVPWLSPSSSGPESSTRPAGNSTAAEVLESDEPALSRYTSAPTAGAFHGLSIDTQTSSAESSRSTPPNEPASRSSNVMARLRSASAVQGRPPRTTALASTTTPDAPTSASETTSAATAISTSATTTTSPTPANQKATIRFFPHQDSLQSSRPSLPFTPIARTLPSDGSVIRVGRYSERDGVPVPNPSEPSDAPVGFKSKVVSRKHCEFSYKGGQWHIKDVGSSSGTFLNHMRLSQPNMVSRSYPIKDGDIVQLGIDFRGGEEMIFRCVRIRIECNRSWQQQPNEFNKNTESLIKNLGKGDGANYSGCRECSICLGSVLRPYQCLFMAACAHVWHYKCISRLLHSPEYPMFQCPNCRAFTDLSAEVDDTPDVLEAKTEDTTEGALPAGESTASHAETQPAAASPSVPATGEQQQGRTSLEPHTEEPDIATDVENLHLQDEDDRNSASGSGNEAEDDRNVDSAGPSTSNDDLARSATVSVTGFQPTQPVNVPLSRSPRLRADTPAETSDDNPLTPRNDMGPLAFDGRAGMRSE